MPTETKPGFALRSAFHEVKFVTAFQLGTFSAKLENKTDWTEMMEILTHSFDFTEDLAAVKTMAETMIVDWLRLRNSTCRVKVNIEEIPFERDNFEEVCAGRKKYVGIDFNDKYLTVFFVTKLRKMETLRDIASEAVSNEIVNYEDIEVLEIPKTLKGDIMVKSKSQWTARWQRKRIGSRKYCRKLNFNTLNL